MTSLLDTPSTAPRGNGPLRVLAIGHSYVLASNRAMLRALSQHDGFEITVAAPAYFHGDLRPIRIEPEPAGSRLRLVSLPAYATRFVHVFAYSQSALTHLVDHGRFDIVHAWEEPYIVSGFQIACALRKSDARLCYYTFQNNVKRYPQPFRTLERCAMKRADAWIAGGSLVMKAMCSKGYPADRGAIITMAVDTDAFRPLSSEDREGMQLSAQLRAPVIGFLGRLTTEKGVQILLDALDRLGSGRPWHLLMLGSGPLEPHIRAWAGERGVADRVNIRLVSHDQVPNILPLMDVMVAPSQTTPNWREQFGRMLIEAFAAGVPVITSDSGEIPWVVGDAAVVVSEQDVAGFASAVQALLDDPAARQALRARGIARATAYATDTIASTYATFFRNLATMPPRNG